MDLSAVGFDAGWARAFRPLRRAGCRPGRVSRVDRGAYPVLTADGPARASAAGRLLAAAAHDLLRLPVAGDWVALRGWPDGRLTVEAVLPRRTTVVRAGAGRDSLGQPLAANVDTAAVVEPLDPIPDTGRIERLLSLVWDSGAAPVLVLTKADRVPDAAALARQLSAVAPGVPVLPVSAADPGSLARLAGYAGPGRTLGLFGASGVGKSTLVNTLVGADVLVTRRLRADGKGRHTTTFRALLPVPGGGAVLDTPGLRSVGLDASSAGLDRAFADIAELAVGCRFGDCRHEVEPGCAVLAALADGRLTARRLDSWRRLRAERHRQAHRAAARSVAATHARDRRRNTPRR